MFSNRWMNKQCVVDSHSELLLSNKKERTIDTHNGKNKSQKTIMLSDNRQMPEDIQYASIYTKF